MRLSGLTTFSDSVLAGLALTAVCCGSMTVLAADPGLAMVTQQPSHTTASIGTTVTFQPQVTSPGLTRYQWLRDGAPISGETNLDLRISECQRSDSGWYVLGINNDAGRVVAKPAYLTVEGSPSGTIQFRNTSIPEARLYSADGGIANGATVELLVGPQPDRMRSAGVVLGVTFGYFTGGSVMLPFAEPYQTVFAQIRVSDGQFSNVFPLTCGAGEAGGTLDELRFPSINWPAPIILQQPQDSEVNVGGSLILSATVRGFTNIRVNWLKDGHPVPVHESTLALSAQTTVEGTTTLEVPSVMLGDAGNYKAVFEIGNQFHFTVSAEANVSVIIPAGGRIERIRDVDGRLQISGSGRPNRIYSLESKTPSSNWTTRSASSSAIGEFDFPLIDAPDGSAWFRLRSAN